MMRQGAELKPATDLYYANCAYAILAIRISLNYKQRAIQHLNSSIFLHLFKIIPISTTFNNAPTAEKAITAAKSD